MSRNDTRPLRLAFCGCGRATATHSRVLATAEGVTLSFASRDPARAAGFRLEFGGDIAHASYLDAMTDPGIDAVVVATPPDRHLDLTLEALRAGKHVVVEKPAWPRAADVGVVRAAAAAAGRRVFVAENYVYKPLLTRLRRLLQEQAVGEPRFVQVNAMRRQRATGWRDDAGVGALYEGGIHWLSLLASLGFRIARVHGARPGAADGADRSMLVVIEYADGPVATLHYSWEIPMLGRGLGLSRIAGTHGVITFETNGVVVVVRGRRTGIWIPGLRDIAGYRAMWADFLTALRMDTEPRMSLDAAERDLKLAEAAYAGLTDVPDALPAWR
ncbi:MAG TPA: Gfo/Idh/MocA family oxidoreductase [Gemmatimonadales bacterium]